MSDDILDLISSAIKWKEDRDGCFTKSDELQALEDLENSSLELEKVIVKIQNNHNENTNYSI